VLGTAPVVPLVVVPAGVDVVAGVVVLAGVDVVAVVVVSAGVDVVAGGVVAGVVVVPVAAVVPVPAAVPAGWLVTNCVNAASNAVNKVLPPLCAPTPWTPPRESESPSLWVFWMKLGAAANMDDRLAAKLVPDTAFVVIISSLFEISTRRCRASPCGHCATLSLLRASPG
jgi:hypothetical protein